MTKSSTQTLDLGNGVTMKELKPRFGAEIWGLHFAGGVSEDDFRIVQDAIIKVSQAASKSCLRLRVVNTYYFRSTGW